MKADGAEEPHHGAAVIRSSPGVQKHNAAGMKRRYACGNESNVANCGHKQQQQQRQQQQQQQKQYIAIGQGNAIKRKPNEFQTITDYSSTNSAVKFKQNQRGIYGTTIANQDSDAETNTIVDAKPTKRRSPHESVVHSLAKTIMRVQRSGLAAARAPAYIRCLLMYTTVLLACLGTVHCDDNDNFFAVNSFSVGPETTTPEFDYASRGQKKFGDKCDNTLECGFPGSICDPKKKSCQCTEDLPVTNHIDKCGKEAAVNESCFFNEQCEVKYFQTECRDGRCVCRFEMSPIWAKDGTVECKGRQDKRGPETYIDPAMIGVLVGMALMFIIICVVLRLFSQARWRENRTIFNTPNPRLMNVSLLRDSKLLHGQERRGSRMSVRAPSRQPSMASLRPHSPNPSLGSHSASGSNASATSLRSRSNSVAPGNVGNHERKGSAHHHRQQSQHAQHAHAHNQQQQQQHHEQHQQQQQVTNITSNPAAENVTVEIIEPNQKKK